MARSRHVDARELALVAALCGFAACSGPRRPESPPPQEVRSAPAQEDAKGRLFSPLDLGFYDQPDRDQWQKPDQIMDALRLADGSIVAEIGAGGGWFTTRLAGRVRPNGHVYAEEIQAPMIELMKRRAQRENLTNITTILGTATDPRLPPGLDAVLILSVYHEMDDPVTVLKNAARSLKPHGLIGIVDFNPGDGGPGPPANERVAPEVVIEGAARADLQLSHQESIPPFCFLLVFRKAGT